MNKNPKKLVSVACEHSMRLFTEEYTLEGSEKRFKFSEEIIHIECGISKSMLSCCNVSCEFMRPTVSWFHTLPEVIKNDSWHGWISLLIFFSGRPGQNLIQVFRDFLSYLYVLAHFSNCIRLFWWIRFTVLTSEECVTL